MPGYRGRRVVAGVIALIAFVSMFQPFIIIGEEITKGKLISLEISFAELLFGSNSIGGSILDELPSNPNYSEAMLVFVVFFFSFLICLALSAIYAGIGLKSVRIYRAVTVSLWISFITSYLFPYLIKLNLPPLGATLVMIKPGIASYLLGAVAIGSFAFNVVSKGED